jgi:N-acetylglucosamine kinase-like BadF-type ATPase
VGTISIYLSVDGGGTKLAAVLFNSEMQVLSRAYGASVNTNFETMEAVERHMRDCITQCLTPWLADHPGQLPRVAYASIVGPMTLFEHVLHDIAPNCRLNPVGEGMMLCLSGCLSQSGIVALSGTGSGIMLCKEGIVYAHLGGWGSLIGDEGSGYAIGRDGLSAAIRANDGWGDATLLTELFIDYYKLSTFHDLIPAIYSSPNPRSTIAATSRVVGKAAVAGDRIALEIYEKAASLLAAQVDGLYKKTGISPERYEVTACGGAWKSYSRFYDVFKEKLQLLYPNINVSRARYEIGAGGAVLYLLNKNPSLTPQEIETMLSPGFDEFKLV